MVIKAYIYVEPFLRFCVPYIIIELYTEPMIPFYCIADDWPKMLCIPAAKRISLVARRGGWE